jgi:hypothetical protein
MGDTREHAASNIDHRDKVARITFDLRTLNLSPEQRERFIFLLGPRYRNSPMIKLTSRKYFTFQENYMRLMELVREIYWESMRAPSRNMTMIRNPYRREAIMKKLLGRTSAERRESRRKLKQLIQEQKKKIDIELAEQEIYDKEVVSKLQEKRRRFAKKRAQIGIDDAGAEEVDDEVLEKMEELEMQRNLKE